MSRHITGSHPETVPGTGETGVLGTGAGDGDDWQTGRLDLAGYLRRLGVPDLVPHEERTEDPHDDRAEDRHDDSRGRAGDRHGGREATAGTPVGGGDAVRRLQRAHQQVLPFGNADILLGDGVELDLPTVQHKLVTEGRGGYCHEHDVLLAAALERLGHPVTRLTGRVRLGGGTALRPRTHMVLSVRFGGRDHLVDVGFGGHAPLEPLPLEDGAEVAHDGWTYRLRQGPPDGWLLQVRDGDGWSDLYSFGTEPAHPVDYRVATHYTATHPSSPFTHGLRLARSTAAGTRLLLQNRRLSELRPDGEAVRGELDDDAFRDALGRLFDIRLRPAERDRLAELTRPTP